MTVSPYRRPSTPSTPQSRSRANSFTSNGGRLEISLRKPFGIGFHVNRDSDDEPIVVEVKGVAARTAGVKPGLKLVELNGRVVGHLGIDALRKLLGQLPTGVDAQLSFETSTFSQAGGVRHLPTPSRS